MFSVISYSQNNGGSLNATGDKSFLPNVTPPSPESFIFTEYGKNAVSEFSGKVNLSIPIYNYKIANLSLPISINYSGAGVKVNDVSTIVGTNWVLNTGGVINRKINDGADESVHVTRKFINLQELITNTSQNCQPLSQYYTDIMLLKDVYDTEIDEWSFNFNGYSGSFYLDENFNPVYVENENELKIEIIGTGANNLEKLRNSQTFVITTPDGIKYFFGGAECEKTMIYSGHRGNSFLENSSFYLYKIADQLNNEINIEYYTDQAAMLHFDRSYQITNVGGQFIESYIPAYTITAMINQINNPKFIKKITNNKTSEEVIFNIDTYNNFHYLASLNNVEIYSNSSLVKKVEFTYDFPNNYSTQNATTNPASRFFLNKVEINKSLLNVDGKYEVYRFEYDNIDLMPSRLSPQQDALGYFNYKDNQTTIARPSYFQNSTSNSFGDLNPDFIYAKRGSLTKVIYPTKGYSTFEYEPIMTKQKVFNDYSLHSVGNSIANIPGDNGFLEDPVNFLGVFEDQEINIKLSTGITPIEGEDSEMIYQIFHNCKAELTILDINTGTTTNIIKNLGMSPSYIVYNFNLIKNHQYQFTLKLNFLANTNTYMQYINANAEFKIFNGFEAINGFGVRIKNQKDYSSDNSFSNFKRYYYKNINELSNDLFGLSEIDLMPKYTFTYNPNPGNFFAYNINLFSDFTNIYSNKSFIESYEVVTTSEGGENFENGGTEKYFYREANEKNTVITTTYDGCWEQYMPEYHIECGIPSARNTGITFVRNHAYTSEFTKLNCFNGKILHERFFSNKNNSIYKNKEITYNYTFNRINSNNAVNFISTHLFSDETALNWCPNDPTTFIYPLTSFLKAYYFIPTFEIKLNKIVSKEYIEPIPLSQNVPYFTGLEQEIHTDYPSHDLNFKKIITTQEFTYGTLRGLPLETKTYSSDGSMLLTKNYYPNQANTLSLSSSNEVIANNKLVSQNRIATPIQVEQYRNGDLLSTQRTINKSWNNNPELILPEKILTSKGTQPLEERAIFSEYDANGNLSVLSLKDGSKTKYFYNNLNQVILKVENYSASLNIPAIPTWSYPCDFIAQYPSALISIYNYDTTTNQIVSIINPNCKKTEYVYDSLHRLKLIKDNDGNIVQEYDQNYKHQN